MAGTPGLPYPHSKRFREHLVALIEGSPGWDGHQVARVEVITPPAGPVILVHCEDGAKFRVDGTWLSVEPGADWQPPTAS